MIRTVLANPRLCVALHFLHGLADTVLECPEYLLVVRQRLVNRNGLWNREADIEANPPIRLVPGSEFFAGVRIDVLAEQVKPIAIDRPIKTQELGAQAMPRTDHFPPFGVVVLAAQALVEIRLGSCRICPCVNAQHPRTYSSDCIPSWSCKLLFS